MINGPCTAWIKLEDGSWLCTDCNRRANPNKKPPTRSCRAKKSKKELCKKLGPIIRFVPSLKKCCYDRTNFKIHFCPIHKECSPFIKIENIKYCFDCTDYE